MLRFRDRTRPQLSWPALYPELAGAGLRLGDGLLRAPPRGRLPPPALSATIEDAPSPPPGERVGVRGRPQTPRDGPHPPLACGERSPLSRSAGEGKGRSAALGPAEVLAARGWEDLRLLARAALARRELLAARVGGEWWHEPARELPKECVVVALRETAVAGLRPSQNERIAAAMLDAAFAENPGAPIVVAASAASASPNRNAILIERPCDPWSLLARAGRVYSAGGELGLLALLAGVPARAFASAFYTGWGLTEDAPDVAQHPFRRSLDEVFAGACLLATRCRDPFHDDTAASFEEVVAVLAGWRRIEEANREIAACVGMSFWKRRRIAEFVRSSRGVPPFRRSVAGAIKAATSGREPRAVAGWASRLPPGLEAAAAESGVKLIRVEDGFIRSVGLGSDFLPPASVVFDTRGMYYDPRGESDLEILLRDSEFSPALRERAQHLAARLVARGVTKYNLPGDAGRLQRPAGRRCILVPGQVEDDLSIRCGAGEARTNLALLARVRADNPDAYIVYKPHPDVLAGHRVGAVPDAEARRFADAIMPGASIPVLLAASDELHTMTSLAGFEALLRGKHVVCHGRPFYAGWGLTDDRPHFERGRRLALDELVAGALILYPRYLDPLTRLPCGPEIVIERLDDPDLWRPGPLVLARRWQGALARRLGPLLPHGMSGGLRARP